MICAGAGLYCTIQTRRCGAEAIGHDNHRGIAFAKYIGGTVAVRAVPDDDLQLARVILRQHAVNGLTNSGFGVSGRNYHTYFWPVVRQRHLPSNMFHEDLLRFGISAISSVGFEGRVAQGCRSECRLTEWGPHFKQQLPLGHNRADALRCHYPWLPANH